MGRKSKGDDSESESFVPDLVIEEWDTLTREEIMRIRGYDTDDEGKKKA